MIEQPYVKIIQCPEQNAKIKKFYFLFYCAKYEFITEQLTHYHKINEWYYATITCHLVIAKQVRNKLWGLLNENNINKVCYIHIILVSTVIYIELDSVEVSKLSKQKKWLHSETFNQIFSWLFMRGKSLNFVKSSYRNTYHRLTGSGKWIVEWNCFVEKCPVRNLSHKNSRRCKNCQGERSKLGSV